MNLNKYIDHTVLKADTPKAKVQQIIDEAIQYDFMSVCINPTWVSFAAEKLAATDVKVCTVIGFPLGANTSTVKAFEAAEAIKNGADEVDMVINIGAAKDGDWDLVESDIQAVVDASKDVTTKVIIETSLLTDEEKVKACQAAVRAGADFVKTSTGFSTAGATVADIALMRQTVGPDVGVKASGGVRSIADAQAMIEAGATRLGTSNGVDIMKGNVADGNGY
ncbi:MAG: deoxyribose-phosphate aldolase [Lactococcus raffinolactis]|jgi:deoxyribose-phosphate aldolase|uniref:deoxyribose-phosphate aldolase n=1 Tax=Pseudolactococcus raffinolactis TaxID=1366 RepID=UPI001C7082EC|nr:deoxyribose-phosphate aldolase [Lactococcus raffinolactis]MBW9298752.1 deoxyribose-phosphate aldolase [Lactococcus raffinolactis]MCH4162579.1 deoxyribose-phosphate aldolase [Lactococcus raffinolactis]MDN5415594.1 deoxyribose-phosphate aldolase [Lactococcus raffinolactis]MDN5472588.1 deoxyribose-phosphate aldolase [Lactococcus raffinolactis]MDN5579172.1 deoxyribose-phosphate aldolase [Lactococcus raffinolactis]